MAGSYQQDEEMKKTQGGFYQQEPVVGIPYGYPPPAPGGQGSQSYAYAQVGQPMYPQPMMQAPPQQAVHYAYQQETNAYSAGMVPRNAIYGPPNGIPLRETFFADTPAPFECSHCGKSGVTRVDSRPSLAAGVACMMTLVGVCFLFKGCDCLWHKEHYCQNCGEKVAEFKKSDPCLLMDPPQWQQQSFALPS
jgi:lipopolysaccharide-induced tumor necrosis factor-alpha factor